MTNNVTSISTIYRGINFRSRLEAKYAAFFDHLNWYWEYEPIDLPYWIPDFRIVIRCGSQFCRNPHALLVDVKPHFDLAAFKGSISCSMAKNKFKASGCDGIAFFGATPATSYWEWDVCVKPVNTLSDWLPDWRDAWNAASNLTQWKKAA